MYPKELFYINMNKKNNYAHNKKNNNRNNNLHNAVQGGRGANVNNRFLNQWNERLLLQRICDGAMVTLLTNAIAVASQSANTSSVPNNALSSTVPISSPTTNSPIAQNDNEEQKEDEVPLPLEGKNSADIKLDSKPQEEPESLENSNTTETQRTLKQNKPTVQPGNTMAEPTLLQTLLASVINHQIINSRKFDKSTQTGRYLQSRPIIPNKMGNICPGFQQQLINNTFLTSNYKFAGLAKTSSVYFTRGVR